MGKKLACLDDPSSHGGKLITTNTDGSTGTGGAELCANGALHQCPISGHGTTPVTAVTVRSFVNGKLILSEGAVAGCGAVIQPPDRRSYVE